MRYSESRTVRCAERHSQNSPGSSSLVVHIAEEVCRHDSPSSANEAHYFYVSARLDGYSDDGSRVCDNFQCVLFE